ncbi:hypothetical protein SeLEV6574_g06981 [Synchytrium endobioticum]|uniref:Uncharacterized protein n=1 Tax=Synchytrium endobioticum TaxID=286115 RepID=A0A507CFD1_9FUNG|nr:hypothetical protein SeLEV6574_g06981 [Synchytrium endobioticum]
MLLMFGSCVGKGVRDKIPFYGYRQGSSGACGMCGRTRGSLPSTTNGWTPARRGVKPPSARCSIPEQRSTHQTANFQFLHTAKGWKIVRRGSEPAAPRSVDDVSPPAADVNSRAAPVAKLTTSSANAPVTASKLPKEAATRKIDAMIEEFYSNFDPAEAGANFKDLRISCTIKFSTGTQ